MRRLALLVLLAAACKPQPAASTAPTTEPATRSPRVVDPELVAAADRLDPGPQPPLHEVLPTWLKGQVDAALAGDPRSPSRLAEAREAIAAWDKIQANDPQALALAGLQLGRGLVLAERAVAAGSDDPELLAGLTTAYRAVSGFKRLRHHGLFGQVFQTALEQARQEGVLEGRQIEEALQALDAAIERAPALQMHATARLLREHPDHPTVPQALVRASAARGEAEQFAEAVALRKLAVAREGARASGGDFVALARTCYEALDLACGDMFRKTAAERGPDKPGEAEAAAFERRLGELDATAEAARRALALASASELAAQIERGHLLLKLNRLSDAESTFTAARRAHPNDARPLTGLAALVGRRDLDVVGMTQHIRAARDLPGRDRLYHEIALGTVPAAMISEVASQMAQAPGRPIADLDGRFAEALALARGYREFDPARAAVIEVMLTAGREAVPKFMAEKTAAGMTVLRRLPDGALGLLKKFPESRDVWRLIFASSRMAASAAKARAQATLPLPAALREDPDLRLQQARALFDVAVLWEDRSLLAVAAEAAATLPAGVDADTAQTLRATVDAVQGRQGDQAALQRAVDAFAALAERKTGRDQAIALNNAAIVVAHVGEVETAMAILSRAFAAAPEEVTAGYNLSAVAFGLQAREGLAENFAAVVERSRIASLRLHARAWLVALAEAGQGDVAVTRAEFAAALAKEKAEELRGRVNPGRWGVVEQSEFNVSFGYSSVEGLVLLDEVVPRWWLTIPAPTIDALLAAKPGKPKK